MVAEIDPRNVKVHWTHLIRIKNLYKEGYTEEELSIAYKLPIWYIKGLTIRIKKPVRI